jgi:CspA family cold shock protein
MFVMSHQDDRRNGSAGAQQIAATVKWFNRTKGFGFVTAIDGSGDVFLPASILALSGHDEVDEGATVVCDVVDGPKGRAVASIHEIDPSTASPRSPRRAADENRPERMAGGPVEAMDGVVKWFDLVRGFGFISPHDGSRDVFIHASALRRSGLDNLTTGQAVQMEVQHAKRGREVVTVTVQ